MKNLAWFKTFAVINRTFVNDSLSSYKQYRFKAKTSFISLLIIILMFTTACQPTPEQEVVIGRQDDIIEVASSVPPDQFKEIEAPDHVNNAYDFEKLSITFDADVIVPKVSAYPVTKVSKRVFSDEDYLALIKQFAGSSNELYSEWTFPKSELLEKIIKAKPYVSTGIVSQDTLDIWQEQYDNTDENPQNPLVQLSGLPASKIIPLYAKNNNQVAQVVIARNGNYFSYCKDPFFLSIAPASLYEDSDFDENADTIEHFKWMQPGESDISQKDAYELALSYVNELNMGLELYSAEPCTVIEGLVDKSVGWRFVFTRKISGLQMPYQDFVAYLNPDALPSCGAPWEPEMCRMVIDENGLVTFAWHGASKLSDVNAESIELKPFDFIQSRIADQLKFIHSNPIRNDVGADIKITKISLGTSLISVKDEPDAGIYVPSWYVDYYIKWSDEDSYNNELNTVILNAIDGSYIEPRVTDEEILQAKS